LLEPDLRETGDGEGARMSGAHDLAAVLARFPKTRPPLPPRLEAIYTRQYLENRSGETPAASLSQRLESWLHRQVAADVKDASTVGATLELGAGTLNQLAYEPGCGAYDIVEPFEALYRGSPLLGGVRATYADIADVPATNRYARVTSVASLEHICDLPPVPRPRLWGPDGPRARQRCAGGRDPDQGVVHGGGGQELRRRPSAVALPLHRCAPPPPRGRGRVGRALLDGRAGGRSRDSLRPQLLGPARRPNRGSTAA